MPFFYSIGPLRRRACAWFAALGLSSGLAAPAASQEALLRSHKQMLDDIVQMMRETQHETGRAVLSDRVTTALAKVPRHRFVPAEEERRAYLNRPLPIGSGQTISQPFIVALMTEFMDVKPDDRVLEIGTGSGYQAAVLAELAKTVYTIEIIEALAQVAAARFQTLGYRNIVTRTGDGWHGWPEQAPFDAIMVTAAGKDIPQPLLDQLKPGGRLVIPVGSQSGAQTLMVVEKKPDGTTSRRNILGVRFVPLTRSQ
jgi:protein-L-isoaspartate(D-aspartate) O-methyltransferase